MSVVPESVRRAVRKRADERCEYCLKPDVVSTVPYHVDHIRSLKHGGGSEPENLAWACFDCNICKGSDIGSFDDMTEQFVPFFNPRIQRWEDHFEADHAHIKGRTAIDRVTAAIFQFNHQDQLATRQDLLIDGLWP